MTGHHVDKRVKRDKSEEDQLGDLKKSKKLVEGEGLKTKGST